MSIHLTRPTHPARSARRRVGEATGSAVRNGGGHTSRPCNAVPSPRNMATTAACPVEALKTRASRKEHVALETITRIEGAGPALPDATRADVLPRGEGSRRASIPRPGSARCGSGCPLTRTLRPCGLFEGAERGTSDTTAKIGVRDGIQNSPTTHARSTAFSIPLLSNPSPGFLEDQMRIDDSIRAFSVRPDEREEEFSEIPAIRSPASDSSKES